jgi:hypothetical protein
LRFLVLLLFLAGCAGPAAEMSDWERSQALKQAPREENVVPPPFPKRAKLVEFPVADTGDIHFFIDASTLSVAGDGIVRYVLVAQSPGGVENITYEGLRCPAAEHRIYASGQSDGTWALSRTTWQPVRNARRWQIELYREYFCPQKVAIRDADEGLRALRAGGHPFAKGFSPNLGL